MRGETVWQLLPLMSYVHEIKAANHVSALIGSASCHAKQYIANY